MSGAGPSDAAQDGDALEDAMTDSFAFAYPYGMSGAEVANVTVSDEFLRLHGREGLRELVTEQASWGHGWESLAAALGEEF